jgi:hypothetical protein
MRLGMSTDIGVVVIGGALPLLGVVIGTGAAVFGQRSSARDSRIRSELEARRAYRAEIKGTIAAYLETTQHLQTQLYAREHDRDVLDIPVMVEEIWLAHAQVDAICSEKLREPLVKHATVLNEVARHEEKYPDWWAVVLPYKMALMDAIREELKWPGAIISQAESSSENPMALLDAYTSWLSQFEGTPGAGGPGSPSPGDGAADAGYRGAAAQDTDADVFPAVSD